MADTTDNEPGGRLYTFPRIGFNLHPTTTPEPSPAPPAGPDDFDDSAPTLTLPTVRVRRSPLGVLDTLPTPPSGQPFVPPAAALPDDLPLPGTVPDTFRSEPPADLIGPRLGALGLAATLAVAVAALRGTHTVLSTWWANRQARQAEGAALREARTKHALAMEQIGHKAAQDRAKQSRKVPSSAEFGRKTLGSRSGSGSGGSGGRGSSGGGGSRSNGTKKPGGGGSSSSRTNGPASKGPKGRGNSGAGGSLRTKKPGSSSGSGGTGGGGRKLKKHDAPRTPKPKSPHSGTQSGSRTGLDKHRTKTQRNGKGGGGGKGRSLPEALAHDTSKAARKRLKQRRRTPDNPVLWKDTRGTKDPLADKRPKKTRDKATKTPKTTGKTTPGGGPDMRRLDQAAWHDLKQAAARRWKKRRKNTPPPWGETKAKKAGRDAQATDANTKQTKARRKNRTRWAKARDYLKNKATRGRHFPGPGTAGRATGPSAGPYGPQQPGSSRSGRRSPFENAGQAAGETTWTVTSEHVPGSRAKRWEPASIGRGTPTLPSKGPAALAAATGKHPARPGTSAPKEPIAMPPAVPARREDPRITRAKKQAARAGHQVITQARHMDARHETEITLDDALDEYSDFAADGFTTHDQCIKLADRAITLRDTLAAFAEHLAVENNLIGALFTGAMARMSESMDLVARMAEEMQTSSLEAAEMAEAADNDLNDAYRPYTQATADAGLAVPSAPVHNEA